MTPKTMSNRLLAGLLWLAMGAIGRAEDPLQAADLVLTNSGKEYRGQVVYEDKLILVLRDNTRLSTFEQADLSAVQAVSRELPKALASLNQLKPDDIQGHLSLAAAMQAANLPHEALLLYWRVLTLDQENPIAHTALGSRLVAGQWKLRAGSSWFSLPKLLEHHGEWSSAWEFETTHFLVKSNLPLREALLAVLDLEHTYAQFYRLFGEAFELHASQLKIGAWIHADEKSYPGTNQKRQGYYQERDRRLYVNATTSDWRNTLVHESVHGIIDFAATHTKSGKGRIPGWLHEGLALYMQPHHPDDSYSDDPRAIGSSGVIRWLMQLHASAQKPFSLKKVLSMSQDDFALEEDNLLRYAHAYSLTFFCLNAEAGKYREAFFGFVRGAYNGKSSSTDFRQALGLREKQLEAAWHAFVQQFKG